MNRLTMESTDTAAESPAVLELEEAVAVEASSEKEAAVAL